MTVLAEKLDVALAIGNLSYNTVCGSLAIQSITGEAVSQFTTVLSQEGNEVMLVHLIQQLTCWIKLSSSNLPVALIERMKVSIYQTFYSLFKLTFSFYNVVTLANYLNVCRLGRDLRLLAPSFDKLIWTL